MKSWGKKKIRSQTILTNKKRQYHEATKTGKGHRPTVLLLRKLKFYIMNN